MSVLAEVAKYIGLSVIAIMFLAVPSLLTLAIVFDWGFFLGLVLASLSVVEIFAVVLIIDNLSKEIR